jgi:hypothetical protein
MNEILLTILGIIGITGLVISLKEYLGPDIPIYTTHHIDTFVPPVEYERSNNG